MGAARTRVAGAILGAEALHRGRLWLQAFCHETPHLCQPSVGTGELLVDDQCLPQPEGGRDRPVDLALFEARIVGTAKGLDGLLAPARHLRRLGKSLEISGRQGLQAIGRREFVARLSPARLHMQLASPAQPSSNVRHRRPFPTTSIHDKEAFSVEVPTSIGRNGPLCRCPASKPTRSLERHTEGRSALSKEVVMDAPFIFIGTHKVKPGKLEEFKAWFADYCDTTVEPNEPRLLAFNAYAEPRRQRGHRGPSPPGRGVHGSPPVGHH